jgi:hypothetical protein
LNIRVRYGNEYDVSHLISLVRKVKMRQLLAKPQTKPKELVADATYDFRKVKGIPEPYRHKG